MQKTRRPTLELLEPLLRRFLKATLLMALHSCFIGSSLAEEKLSPWAIQLGAGMGSHQSKKVDFAAVWDPQLSWKNNGKWHFSMVGEAHLAQWRVLNSQNVTEVGITPVFIYSKNTGAIQPYAEAGLGVRLLSHARMSSDYTLSSAFQFTEIIGIGATFGPEMRYKIGLRLQHISNAGIKFPNPGINFIQTFIQYHF